MKHEPQGSGGRVQTTTVTIMTKQAGWAKSVWRELAAGTLVWRDGLGWVAP